MFQQGHSNINRQSPGNSEAATKINLPNGNNIIIESNAVEQVQEMSAWMLGCSQN